MINLGRIWLLMVWIGTALGVLWGVIAGGRLRCKCRCGAPADGGWISGRRVCQDCFEREVLYGRRA